MPALYWGPGTCAIGIQVLLEESGRPYRTIKVDVHGGGTRTPEFLAINPKGKVPTLVREDGTVLTEFGAIATWLGLTDKSAGLLPRDPESGARVAEMIAYVEGTIHGQGYGRLMRPDLFEPQDALHTSLGIGQAAVRRQGREIVEQGFAVLDADLAGHAYAIGDSFTIADAALFYVERWAPQHDVDLPRHVASHFARLKERPAIQCVMQQWKNL
ncbi:glutathione S-transferase family protein [Sphingomonas naphthae]|uniref:Glutathione S-transferase family protein n=1 Tax=Sphingomonas naphthae TaxID=1813468 RepID=A0ABY7TN81_9SPHN|nr:glutathione S-transferase family protein [Sphingomonas naphthae]WCT74659.1 glutathione S-transferase family protein [Sphingomonas naphthae]